MRKRWVGAPIVRIIMQTFLFIWPATSIAIFAMALIITRAEGNEHIATSRIALLAVLWPLILTGLMVSFAVWYLRSSLKLSAARSLQP